MPRSIERISDRDTFRRLRSDGRRFRSGPLSVVVRRVEGRRNPAVAYAIPKRVGPAVTRNRLRRRLRELFRELERRGELVPAEYLVLVDPAAASCDFATLRGHLNSLNRKLCAVPG